MLTIFIAFGVFLLLGMPVAFAIGISGFICFVQQTSLPFTMPSQLILSETQNFALLAIPMFIFAGNLLNNTGITSRLMKLSSVLAGHMYGGLAQTSVVLSTLMGGVSGSAIADASMQSRILGPEMVSKGYRIHGSHHCCHSSRHRPGAVRQYRGGLHRPFVCGRDRARHHHDAFSHGGRCADGP